MSRYWKGASGGVEIRDECIRKLLNTQMPGYLMNTLKEYPKTRFRKAIVASAAKKPETSYNALHSRVEFTDAEFDLLARGSVSSRYGHIRSFHARVFLSSKRQVEPKLLAHLLDFIDDGSGSADVLRSEVAMQLSPEQREKLVKLLPENSHTCWRIVACYDTKSPADWPALSEDEVRTLIPTAIKHACNEDRDFPSSTRAVKQLLENDSARKLFGASQLKELGAYYELNRPIKT